MVTELIDAPLAQRTTLGVGGPAGRLRVLTCEAEVVAELRAAGARGEPFALLGGGSNVVVADEGLALVYQMATRGAQVVGSSAAQVRLRVEAGEPWDEVVARCVDEGWAGVECLSGIPGLVGATPIQNVGAYGQQIADVLESVRVLEPSTGIVSTLPAAQCGLGYRTSVFKESAWGRYVVLAVTLRLRRGAPAPPRYTELARALAGRPLTLPAVREAVLDLRRAKSMVVAASDPESRSAGSFFLNPVVAGEQAAEVERRALAGGLLAAPEAMPSWPAGSGRRKLAAGWLIERAGFPRGLERGRVGLSRRHALAIVNRGGATAREVLALAGEVKRGVRDRFGVSLRPEPVLLGFPPTEIAPLLEG